jgi:hypothetical protein
MAKLGKEFFTIPLRLKIEDLKFAFGGSILGGFVKKLTERHAWRKSYREKGTEQSA